MDRLLLASLIEDFATLPDCDVACIDRTTRLVELVGDIGAGNAVADLEGFLSTRQIEDPCAFSFDAQRA